MDRRQALTGLAATVAGATVIPAIQISTPLEGKTVNVTDLMKAREAAQAHADHVEKLWRVANLKYQQAKPPKPACQERAEATRQWEAECQQVKVSTGFAAIEQADSDAIDALLEAEDEILNAPVTCLADMQAKLTILTSHPQRFDGGWQECLEVFVQQIADATPGTLP